ncbi:outer membrane protein assembly factor BamA [Calditrichota bacterium]
MQKFKIVCLFASILMLVTVNILTAQDEPNLKLASLRVEGNFRTDEGLIIATSGLFIGEPLSGEKLQNTIRQLWKLNLFSDIKLVASDHDQDGVHMVIRIKELPRLELVEISGGKKIGKTELEDVVDLKRGRVLHPSDPIRLKRKIKKLAEEKGYLLADVDINQTEGSDSGLVELRIEVSSGKKVKIKEIIIAGNEAFTKKKLLKQFDDTKEKRWYRSGEFHREELENDLALLQTFYREHGYRDFRVLGDSIWYTDDRKRMYLKITVEEGSQMYFGDIEFSGDKELFTEYQLRSQLAFQRGDVFNQTKFDLTLRERLGSMFYDKGYIYAQIIPTIRPSGGDTLDIDFSINPGNRFSVRNIHITGNTKTREKVIRREFVLKPGDTFDVSKLRRSVREVAILNYFADIQPDIEDVSDDEVDIWVSVEEKPTDQANLSAGYSERDGVIGSIGFTAPNLLGSGQQASFDWSFGQQYGSFTVSYTEPWFLDTETLLGGSFYQTRRYWSEGFTEGLIGGSVRVGRRFAWPDDYFRGDWIYRIERSQNTNIKLAIQDDIDGDPRISSSMTQIISRDSRDFAEFPTRGSVASLTTELAGGPFGGNDKYHRHIVSLEWYSPYTKKVVLYSRYQYGFMAPFTNNKNDIPYLKYFYMGGSGLSLGTPLRGYAERTVGPASNSTSAQGGKSQMKFSMELRGQLVDNPTIYGLLFAEAGNTWLNFERTDPFDLRRSAGLGLRLFMPMIGLIGLDYGYGFDKDFRGRGGGWTPHFQFGRTF